MGIGDGVDRGVVWRERFQRKKASGLSVAAFCRRERVSEASYYYWKRRLAETKGLRNEKSSGGKGRFVAIDLTQASRANDSTGSISIPDNSLEIVLRDGRRVVVPDRFQEDTLRSILAVLEDSAC